MDRGPGPRRARGNAFYVESARSALGLGGEVHSLSDVPLPLVHTALAVAVCAVISAVRPQAVGVRSSVLAAAALAAVSSLSLAAYDHLVYGRRFPQALAAMALPVAAVAAFVVVLGGSEDLALRIPAGVAAVLIMGGVPHLGSLRAVGREGTLVRLLRDGAGVAVLAPILLVSFGGGLAVWSSACLAGVAVYLVTFDALRTDGFGGRSAVASAVPAAVVIAALVVVLPPLGRGTIRAAALLLFWYGLRGILSGLRPELRRAGATAEYAVFISVAVVVIAWGALRG